MPCEITRYWLEFPVAACVRHRWREGRLTAERLARPDIARAIIALISLGLYQFPGRAGAGEPGFLPPVRPPPIGTALQ
jgi:hypothetical protein